MKHKLVLIFDEDNEIIGIEPRLIFNNVLDAENYLILTGKILFVKIEPEPTYEYFEFKTNTWTGRGRAFWAISR